MNPETGTFISMDKYQGSIDDPISLHKYLYANANPVMNSDPTGYFSIGEMATIMAIQGILGGMASAGLSILRFLTRSDSNEKFNWGSFAIDVILGTVLGTFFGRSYAYARAIQSFSIFMSLGASGLVFSGLSLYGSYEEWENGNKIMALTNLGLAGLGVFGSYKSFQGALGTPTGQKAVDWAKSLKGGSSKAWGSNDSLVSSANLTAKGNNTAVGRAFQKHSVRKGTAFKGEITGNASKNTQQGMNYLDKIISDPNSTFTVRNTRAYGEVLDVRLPDGVGARWSADGKTFIGFLEGYTRK